MREIDEVRVEGNVLTIFDTRGERHRFKMGVPEQVYEEVVTKLRPLVTDGVGRRVSTVYASLATGLTKSHLERHPSYDETTNTVGFPLTGGSA